MSITLFYRSKVLPKVVLVHFTTVEWQLKTLNKFAKTQFNLTCERNTSAEHLIKMNHEHELLLELGTIREKFCNPLVLWTTIIKNSVVRSPKLLV